MPIHDLGYRAWEGETGSGTIRFWVIARSGIQVVMRNKWVRRVLLAAWLPIIFFAFLFFTYEQYLDQNQGSPDQQMVRRAVLAQMTEGGSQAEIIRKGLTAEDPGRGRNIIWSWLMSTFLQIPQAISAMLIIGMIAPALIAKDLRSRAFLLYFSRPINRYEYVIGKVVIVSSFLAFITMLPVLVCYLFGIALSSDPGAIFDTWDLPIRAVVASLVFIIPAVSVALMFSSLTSESRFAAFAWFATWGLGAVAWNVIFTAMYADSSMDIERDFRSQMEERGNLESENDPDADSRRSLIRDEAQDDQYDSDDDPDNGTPGVGHGETAPGDVIPPSDPTSSNLAGAGDSVGDSSEGDDSNADDSNADDSNADDSNADDSNADDSDETRNPGHSEFEEGQTFRDRFGREIRISEGRFEFVDPEEARLEEIRQAEMLKRREEIANHPLSLISMYHTLIRLQRWVFGLDTSFVSVLPSLLVTIFVTVFSWFIMLRRVAAPIRI